MKKVSDITILVVDAKKENQEEVGSVFKDWGYKFVYAGCGLDAMDIISNTQVTLVLLDIIMPGMDGFEVCHLLKNNPKTRDIPVIFLTSTSESENLVTSFLLGGVDYITKPFRPEELICRVNNQLDLIKARKNIVNEEKEQFKIKWFPIRLIQRFGNYLNKKI